jgi:hypothetical protein
MTDLTETKQDRTFFDKNETMNAHSYDRIIGHPVRDCRVVLGLSHQPANNKSFISEKYNPDEDKVEQDYLNSDQNQSIEKSDDENAADAVSCFSSFMR